ncbi:D-alanine--D-alanine ligase [Desulforudis sp. 1031]|uniref:D-alanine--D-alanine ligase n=1 Tax=unclassified Candidatus Desulforudis TaxID=2635950 RepID=UPI003CE46F63
MTLAGKIGVLMGGHSAEREVSLKSGTAVLKALAEKGLNAVAIDLGEKPAAQIEGAGIEFAFIALHGRFGEDGTVQGLLELLGIPYTGSGVLASALGMNKIATKRLLNSVGLPNPRFTVVKARPAAREGFDETAAVIAAEMGVPLVVKPCMQGSSIGVHIVRDAGDLPSALQNAFRYDRQLLVEEFIPGVEITAAVLGNDNPEVLPLIEITSATGVYDYTAKYTPGKSFHIIPPRLPQDIQDRIKDLARQTFELLGCRGFARVDFIVGKDGPLILELNTIPGMTEVSLYPDAARAAGISFPDLVERLIALGME